MPPLRASLDSTAIVSVGLAYIGPLGMTSTVGIGVVGKSLQETKQGVSNTPLLGHFCTSWLVFGVLP